MPWTLEDVESHKSDLTKKQKEVWVTIANDVREKCIEKDGDEKTCDIEAIKQANAVAIKVLHNDVLESIEYDDDDNIIVTFYTENIFKMKVIEDFEYLIHHIELNNNKEEIHHCMLYDHIGNLFEQSHLVIKDGVIEIDGRKIKEGVYHVIIGLELTQDVCWSDEQAEDNGIVPKKMNAGMTYKQKSKEW